MADFQWWNPTGEPDPNGLGLMGVNPNVTGGELAGPVTAPQSGLLHGLGQIFGGVTGTGEAQNGMTPQQMALARSVMGQATGMGGGWGSQAGGGTAGGGGAGQRVVAPSAGMNPGQGVGAANMLAALMQMHATQAAQSAPRFRASLLGG